MNCRRSMTTSLSVVVALAIVAGSHAQVPYTYTDWLTPLTNGIAGTITIPNSTTIGVAYTGTYFNAQLNGGTNYWIPSTPYTGSQVLNAPSTPDIITVIGGPPNAVNHSLTFSQPVSDLVMDWVSLGTPTFTASLTFSEPFSLISQGTGYWGPGTLSQNGNMLNGNEGHGTILFTGPAFTTLTWTDSFAEQWHGFTVGVPVPEPASLFVLAAGGLGAAALRRRAIRTKNRPRSRAKKRLGSVKLALCILSLAVVATSIASSGSSWIVATQPAPVVESYFWDYTEAQSTVTNMRQSSVSGNTTNRIHDFDFGNNGILYGAGKFGSTQTNQYFEGAYIVNPGSGQMTQIASIGLMAEGDMSFDPLMNRLVVIGNGAGITSAYQVDLANLNAVSTLWTSTAFDDVSGVAFDSSGNGFIVDSHVNTGGQAELFSFSNSGATSVGSLGINLGGALGMDFDANNQLHLLGLSGNLYHVNGLTPTLVDTISNPLGHQYTGLAYSPVPEPASMIALGVGGLCLISICRRRK